MCAYDEDLPPFDSAQRSLRKNTMLNILTEPVIRLDLSGGVRKDANLPEVFAALVSDKVVSFPALRPHQRHAWHAFLVQLGAMAMHRAGGADLPDIADEWAKLIRGLTPRFPGRRAVAVGGGGHHQARLHAGARFVQREGEGLQGGGRHS